jgi:hypothetical protein
LSVEQKVEAENGFGKNPASIPVVSFVHCTKAMFPCGCPDALRAGGGRVETAGLYHCNGQVPVAALRATA